MLKRKSYAKRVELGVAVACRKLHWAKIHFHQSTAPFQRFFLLLIRLKCSQGLRKGDLETIAATNCRMNFFLKKKPIEKTPKTIHLALGKQVPPENNNGETWKNESTNCSEAGAGQECAFVHLEQNSTAKSMKSS
jgi:hypothetical protein